MKFLTLPTFLFFGFTYSSTAQVCNGSLGDPVINETFGTRGYQLAPNQTTYRLVGGCPNTMGTYTLSGFLFGCGPRSWVQMVGDHTPNDSEGNYMLVNAASTPGTVYMDTAKNLCGNTVYQFGMWATPVMNSFACDGNAILPDLQYQVKTLSGTVLSSGSTGILPIVNDREWKFYSLSIQTPANVTDVIISITINPEFGCGSAFAIDDITLRPCSPSLISATLNGSAGPIDVCADHTDTWILNAAYTPGFTDPVFQWQSSIDSGRTWIDIPGETTLTYTAPHRTSGTVLYRACIAERGNVSSVNCRITSNTIHTGVHPLPIPNAPQTVIGCIGKDFHFPPADPSALQALWTGPNGYNSTDFDAVIPAVQYSDTGLYKLRKTFYYSCVLIDTFYLKVFPGTILTVEPVYPICEGTSEQLYASATDTVSFLWTPSAGLSNSTIPDPIATPTEYTEYKVFATNKYGCTDSALLIIDVYKKPVADAGPDRKINLGDSVILDGLVKGTSVNFSWSPPVFINDTHLAKPTVYPPQDGIYTLTVNSTVGCGSSISTVKVTVYKDVYIPTAFTPNNDGKNDKFGVMAADNYKQFRLLLYNRWGQLMYRTNNINQEWDGRFNGQLQSSGVYVYYVEIQTASNKRITRKGSVILIR